MILMNGDIPVLEFDLEDMYLKVLNNQFLPYVLKDYIQTTDIHNFKKSIKDIEVLRDYLSNRMLNLSRDNAKVILNVLALPQTLKTEDRIKIVLACRSLSMTDNFWTKENNEKLYFKDVCLRNHKLSEASFQIAVLGNHISAQLDDLKADLLTQGMFIKTWRRGKNGVELWKTDKTSDNINAKAEVEVSNILDAIYPKIPHVFYRLEKENDLYFAVSDCFTNDAISFVSAQDVKDYCSHIGTSFEKYINDNFSTEMANMTILDYILANTDRHFENWGFLIDNNTNKIISFAPLFDHNQALIADIFHTDIDKLIYEPTGESFISSAIKASEKTNMVFNLDYFPDKYFGKCYERYNKMIHMNLEENMDIQQERE